MYFRRLPPIPPLLLTTAVLLFTALLFAQRINLTAVDLGRHLKNGELFIKYGTLLHTNHYSYTEPDYSVITHHWGSGVLFYLVYRLLGFPGISLVYIGIIVTAVFLMLRIGEKIASLPIAALATVFSVPLIATRIEIRPEGITYLLFAAYLFLLLQFHQRKISYQVLAILLLSLQLLWVNTHIFFIFGWLVFFVYAACDMVNQSRIATLPRWGSLLAGLIGISLINPFGLQGLFEPFMILREYGYDIVENQTLLFMQRRFPAGEYIHTMLASLLIIIAWFFVIARRKTYHSYLPFFIISTVFGLLSWSMIRMISLIGLSLIPLTTVLLRPFENRQLRSFSEYLTIVIISSGLLIRSNYYAAITPVTGIGLMSGVEKSYEFFQKSNLHGPILNNYDIGSYLIFYLPGEEKVFVDNRPEAYSVSFFKDIYIPMQSDETVWHQILERYQFNVIYFNRHDRTPWAQPFLIRRIKDPDWAPVYADAYTLILVRRTSENQSIIERHELSQEYFVVR